MNTEGDLDRSRCDTRRSPVDTMCHSILLANLGKLGNPGNLGIPGNPGNLGILGILEIDDDDDDDDQIDQNDFNMNQTNQKKGLGRWSLGPRADFGSLGPDAFLNCF